MSRRTKIIIAIIVILLLLLGMALFLLTRGTAPTLPEVAAPAANQPTGGLINSSTSVGIPSTNVNVASPPPEPVKPPDESTGVRQLARSFAERYGSFSNQGNFENLLDLRPFMSTALGAKTDAYVAAESAKPPAQTYYGVTTRSINVQLDAFDNAAGTAKATVKTQRQEFRTATGRPDVYYQDVVIEMVKEGGTWKADSATWSPR